MKSLNKEFSKVENIIFDLDGTLIDSSKSIVKALSAAFKDKSINPKNKLDESIIGPSIDEIIESNLIDDNKSLKDELKKTFIEIYDRKVCSKCNIYPNTMQTLDFLRNKGKKLFIITNKREFPTLKILEDKSLLKYFEYVYCIDSFKNTGNLKKELIQKLIEKNQLSKDSFVYVGDTMADYDACLFNNIEFIFASYGYGSSIGKEVIEIKCLSQLKLFF